MGRHSEEIALEKKSLEITGKSYRGLRVLQMGAIEHKTPEPRMPAKEWYLQERAKEVVSIDLNAQDDSIPHDLDTPIPADLESRFDLVTNYGTGEHVNNQYMFFKNMHDTCREGGIMIHQLNHEGFIPDHGRYYYSTKTVFRIAKLCAYSILCLENQAAGRGGRRTGVLFVAFRKRKESSFPTHSWNFLKKAAIVDTGDGRRTGDYNAAGFGKLPNSEKE